MATTNDQTFSTQAIFATKKNIKMTQFAPITSATNYHEKCRNQMHKKQEVSIKVLRNRACLQRKLEKAHTKQKLSFDRMKRLEPQMFKMPGNINKACEAVTTAMDKLPTLSDAWQETGTKATELMQTIVDFLKPFAVPGLCLLTVGSSVYFLLRSLMRGSWLDTVVAATTLCKQLGISAEKLLEGYQRVMTFGASLLPQAAVPDVGGMLCNFSESYNAMGMLLTSVSLLIRGHSIDYNSVNKSLADFGRASIGYKQLTGMIEWIVDYTKDYYYYFTTGKTLEEIEYEKNYPELAELMAVSQVLISSECKSIYFDQSEKLCKLTMQVWDSLESYRLCAYRVRDEKVQRILSQRITAMMKPYESAKNSPVFAYASRAAPLAMYFYGDAGTGKSNLVLALSAELYKEYYANTDWNLNNVRLNRCSDNEFWDGYFGQPILLYDDIFQRKDEVANPNPEVMEIIRTVNDSPYHLHMSDIKDKKNTYFTSNFVIGTSNVLTPAPNSIADRSAIHRRFDLAYKVMVNPQFAKRVVVDGRAVIRIDKKAVAKHQASTGKKGFCKEVYSCQLYDVSNGMDIGKPITYNQLVAAIKAEKALKDTSSSDFQDSFAEIAGTTAQKDTTAVSALLNKLNGMRSESEEVISFADVDFEEILAECEDEFKECSETVQEQDPYFGIVNFVENKIEKWWVPIRECVRARFPSFCEIASRLVRQVSSFAMSVLNCLWAMKGSVIVTVLAGLFTSTLMYGMSSFYHFANFDAVANFDPPENTFYFVREKVAHPIGSVEHGIGYLKAIVDQMPYSEGKERYWQMLRTAQRERYNHLKEESSEIKTRASIVYCPESNVTKTRAVSKFNPESNETKTRASWEYSPESNEVTTRAVKQYAPEFIRSGEMLIYKDGSLKSESLKSQSSDLVQLEQWESVCKNNMVRLDASGNQITALFITGRLALVPYHFIRYIKESFYITNPWTRERTIILKSECDFSQCTDAKGMKVDLCLVSFPCRLPSRKNIKGCFATAASKQHATEGGIVVAGLRMVGNFLSCVTFHSDKVCPNDYIYNYEGNTAHESYSYKVDTRPGDCGAILYSKCKLVNGKILGMHVAGLNGDGLSIAISQEFLTRNIDALILDSRVTVDGGSHCTTQFTPTLTAQGDCISLGYLPQPSTAMQSQILPSLVHGVLAEPLMKPAYLKAFTKDGITIDPMEKGIAKVLTTQVPLNNHILAIATHDVKQVHVSTHTRKILTYEESIRGCDDGEYFSAINRNTSPGYPYTLTNPGQGKHHWFGNGDDFIYSPEIKRDVEQIIENAKKNVRSPIVYMATLKDERRPIAKVDAGKTRVFAAAPMHYSLAVRMYFLSFVNSLMTNRIDNEVGVGTNVYNMDWHRTGQSLRKKGDKVIAGDFSNFDGSLHQEILWSVLDIINDWYDDGPENAQIRRVLFEDICNAKVLVKGELIQMTHSQPSGNPLTVVVNSLFNQIVMRMAYIQAKVNAGMSAECDFRKNVSMQTFGDDNCLNIADSVIEWYNQETITPALAHFGLTYTDEAKTGTCVPYRSLNEIRYLKRDFELRDGIFRGPLEFSVVIEMMNWCKGKNVRAATKENVETALRELALHGESIYESWIPRIQKACDAADLALEVPLYCEIEDGFHVQLFGKSAFSE